MSVRATILQIVIFLALGLSTNAADTDYAITPVEHAACDADVESLCADQVQNEGQVLACMRSKREQLTPVCKTAFEAGMRKRRLSF